MMKKIFGMAAMSALVLGMFACSDGEDGINGKDGKDGADGVACTVKALKDDSGFKVLCDGDSVGVLKNGTDGKAGKDGKNGADGKDGEDGEDGADGSGSAGKDGKAGTDGSDGTACTAKAVKDGFAVICGKDTVGTIKNGAEGKDAEGCTLKEGDNGVTTVTCGEKSVNLFKATCYDARVPYDPETQVCYSYYEMGKTVYVPVQRCKNQTAAYSWLNEDDDASGWSYDPREFFCDNNVLVPKCVLKDKDLKDSSVTFDYENEWCDTENNKISDKVLCGDDDDGKNFKRKPTEYCYRNAGDPATRMRTKPLEECGSGNNLKKFSPVTQFCARPGVLGDMAVCVKSPESADDADQYNIDIRYMASENLLTKVGQMCDNRDGKIYNTKSNDSYTWMTENLRYEGVNKKTHDLDSSSFWFMDDPSNEELGRLYLWSAVIDSAALANVEEPAVPKYCGYLSGEVCTFDKPVQGVCPDGWHVPSKAEGNQITTQFSNVNTTKLMEFNVTTKAMEEVSVSYSTSGLWTSDDYNNEYSYRTYNGTNGSNVPKKVALPVRCIKNAAEEVTP